LDALRSDLRQFIRQPDVEFNPVWGKRTWPARVAAALTRPTESAEPIPAAEPGPEKSQPPNKPDLVDAPTPAGPAGIINVGYDPAIVRALTYALKRARPAYTADAPIVAETPNNSAKPPIPEKLKNFVAGYIKDTKASGKVPTKQGLYNAARTALLGATRARLRAEYEKQTPTLSPGRPRKDRE